MSKFLKYFMSLVVMLSVLGFNMYESKEPNIQKQEIKEEVTKDQETKNQELETKKDTPTVSKSKQQKPVKKQEPAKQVDSDEEKFKDAEVIVYTKEELEQASQPKPEPEKKPEEVVKQEVVHETQLETELFDLINEYRSSNGVELIQFSSNQYSKADKLAHSKADADMKNSSHYANEISIVYGGERPTAAFLLQMWKNSPSHNDFLLGYRKHFGGCAVYSVNNTYYAILEARIDDR